MEAAVTLPDDPITGECMTTSACATSAFDLSAEVVKLRFKVGHHVSLNVSLCYF